MVDGFNYHMITGTLNPTCKNNRIMLSTHVLEQHHHALGRHFIRKTMLTNNNDGFKLCHQCKCVTPAQNRSR